MTRQEWAVSLESWLQALPEATWVHYLDDHEGLSEQELRELIRWMLRVRRLHPVTGSARRADGLPARVQLPTRK